MVVDGSFESSRLTARIAGGFTRCGQPVLRLFARCLISGFRNPARPFNASNEPRAVMIVQRVGSI